METAKLKKFAQKARRELIEQVSARLSQVLAEDSLARREHSNAVKKLQTEVQAHGEQEGIERAAYTWFNRFCALRFMDANHYNRIGVVSPAEAQTQPEILAEAKSGHVDESMVPEAVRKRVLALLGGQEKSRDPQGQAYRLLLVAVCNHWHEAMPFMFERIADYTELLMPDDLLSESAVLGPMREAMTVEACQDVEIIGWLYQFYISEKKDQVFAGLKKNRKITAENIPAATQLFTPHWIVRYLVENSLGRLWLLNRPGSKLTEQMDYYIKPEQAEVGFLRIAKPEEIKVCDPACGSGHMLTYAFDLLYAIYEEEGCEPAEIPGKILTHNLYGIEIDKRAGELAAFALTMKARAKQRRFFNKGVRPKICVLENVHFDEGELKDYMEFFGRELFTASLQTTLRQFEEADNFGSLIRPDITDVDGALKILAKKNVSGKLFISMTHQKILQALRQADYLSMKYHVVIANPPYMGSKGMNGRLSKFLSNKYPSGKSDLMTAFVQRAVGFIKTNGFAGIVTLDSWMFLSSFVNFRESLLSKCLIDSLIHVGWNCFPQGHTYNRGVGFVLSAGNRGGHGRYVNLSNVPATVDKKQLFLDSLKGNRNIHRVDQSEFSAIPGRPVAYWVSAEVRNAFVNGVPLYNHNKPLIGMRTGDNLRFLRFWYEISQAKASRNAAKERKWFPYTKGGDFRRWYGNNEYVVNWLNNGYEIKKNTLENYPELSWDSLGWKISNESSYFKQAISWTCVSSSIFSARFIEKGSLFDTGGSFIPFKDELDNLSILAFLNTKVTREYLTLINPTINYGSGTVGRLPWLNIRSKRINIECLINASKQDWDAYETSWDFTTLPLLSPAHRGETLEGSYARLRAHWQGMMDEMQRLEEENNRIFIDAYGLQDELNPEVPIEEITLTCNPSYRYGVKGSEKSRETRLLADTLAEFLSYAVGCMFGRYSLDKPGLILANQGETIEDYLRQVPDPSFEPDDDNVVPILDAAWFTDGIVERFREFLKVTFGAEHYEENLEFIENALGKNIRKYFLNDFYKDHVRRYKKRPIYWLFSSPKGSFNALIYMHRYRPDTGSVILNDYLREFRTKLEARLTNLEEVEASTDASKREKTTATKEINQIRSTTDELLDWERKVMLPLAEQKIEIDLDDGVKANYPKFGAAIKKIPGLS